MQRERRTSTTLLPLSKVPVHTTGRFTKSRGVAAPRGFLTLLVAGMVGPGIPTRTPDVTKSLVCGCVEVKQQSKKRGARSHPDRPDGDTLKPQRVFETEELPARSSPC